MFLILLQRPEGKNDKEKGRRKGEHGGGKGEERGGGKAPGEGEGEAGKQLSVSGKRSLKLQ